MNWNLNPNADAATLLREQGACLLSAAALGRLTGAALPPLQAAAAHWDDLPSDDYLRDGGHYRFRRHGSFVQELAQEAAQAPAAAALVQVPHRPHWQPTTYNALHGGIERWFEPLAEPLVALPAWTALVGGLGRLFATVQPVSRWYIEAHAFRTTTSDGLGRPTPEGAHRDGVDFVAVVMVNRHRVRGGETRVFQAEGPQGVRFTLSEPWSALLLDDARVVHETTPIQPDGEPGHRDTLVLTYRAGGFQDPPAGRAGSAKAR
jgi:hypothetical protein